MCAWLHDSEIKVRPQEDPTGVKRKMEDFNDDSNANEPRKNCRKNLAIKQSKAKKETEIGGTES